MALHNELGRAGEQAAVDFLVIQGFIIRERNWKVGHLELDIVAEKDGVIHFVEVKTRAYRNPDFNPFKAIDKEKQTRIVRASKSYCRFFGLTTRKIQYDVIVVYGDIQFEVEYYPKFRMYEPPRYVGPRFTGPRKSFPRPRKHPDAKA